MTTVLMHVYDSTGEAEPSFVAALPDGAQPAPGDHVVVAVLPGGLTIEAEVTGVVASPDGERLWVHANRLTP